MIYCIEDDDNIRELMLYTLQMAGIESRGFASAKPFWQALEDKLPDLILLDIMLPEEDGLSILSKLKAHKTYQDIPLVMATAKGSEFDKVQSLDMGADDYLVKPFGMMELVSRIKAVLRRSSKGKAIKEGKSLSLGSLTLNKATHEVTNQEKKITLTLKEFDLLAYFMSHPNQVFSREELLNQIWGSDFVGESRTVDVHIGTLRSKLTSCGSYIQTIRGLGYKMEPRDD